MTDKRMPFDFQTKALLKIGARLAAESGVDPVYASNALDFLDSTLSYEENKRIYFEELERRGIRTVPEEEKAKADFEKFLGESLYREVPGLEEYVGEIRTEAAVAQTELGKLKEKHTKLKEESKRWKELSEVERARLMAELDEMKRNLENLLGGLPRVWVEELMVVFMKLPKATEERFWTWLKENLALAKGQYEAKVLATSLEPSMREWLEKKPVAPPKPAVAPRPEPKYKIGEEAFETESGRKVIVRQQLFNELTKKWDYLVDDRGKIKRVTETGIVPLPPLPAPAARPARAPAAPRAPPTPKTLEEIAVCPFTKHALRRFEEPLKIKVTKPVTLEEDMRRRMKGAPEYEIVAAIRNEVWARQRTNPMFRDGSAVVRQEEVLEDLKIPPGFIVYVDDKKECPGYSRFYMVEDSRLKGYTYDELVVRIQRFYRRIAPPPPRPPTPPPRMGPFLPFFRTSPFRHDMTDEEMKRKAQEGGVKVSDEGLKYLKKRLWGD
jgi:hypothetical protein